MVGGVNTPQVVWGKLPHYRGVKLPQCLWGIYPLCDWWSILPHVTPQNFFVCTSSVCVLDYRL